MKKEFYYDSSIWIDFHEKRGKNGESALRLILKIINEDLKIAYSDLNVKEFKNLGYTKDEINSILRIVKPNNINDLQLIATDPHFEKLKDVTTAKKPEDFI